MHKEDRLALFPCPLGNRDVRVGGDREAVALPEQIVGTGHRHHVAPKKPNLVTLHAYPAEEVRRPLLAGGREDGVGERRVGGLGDGERVFHGWIPQQSPPLGPHVHAACNSRKMCGQKLERVSIPARQAGKCRENRCHSRPA